MLSDQGAIAIWLFLCRARGCSRWCYHQMCANLASTIFQYEHWIRAYDVYKHGLVIGKGSLMIIRLPGCWPLVLTVSLAHWKPNGTQHGAKSNPAVIKLSLVRLLPTVYSMWGVTVVKKFPSLLDLPMSEGWRLWIYCRSGYAWCCDLYIDRRDLDAEKRIIGT